MAADLDLRLLRPADLLVLQIELQNLRLSDRSLVRAEAGKPASVVLVLPPQHYREPWADTPNFLRAAPIAAGAPCRLEFVVPDGVDKLPIPATGVLGLCEELRLDPTSPIWVPARAYLQPVDTQWTLGLSPIEHGGRADLWRAKAVGPRREGQLEARFELFSVDVPHEAPEWPVVPSPRDLTEKLRIQALTAHRFDLSPLGASVRMRGLEPGSNAGAYEHDIDFGRDTRVQIVERGHLSTGHPATLFRVVRREFSVSQEERDGLDNRSVAWLYGQVTIVVDEPVVPLHQLGSVYPNVDRLVPFRTLRMVTVETPPLDDSLLDDPPTGPFRIKTRQGHEVLFDVVATDHADREIELHLPLDFFPRNTPRQAIEDRVEEVVDRIPAGGQRLTLAPPGRHDPGSTTVVADWLHVTFVETQPADSSALPADGSALPVGFDAPVLPSVWEMGVVLEAAAQFTGAREVAYAVLHDTFREHGMGSGNPQGALLSLAKPTPLKFAARNVGGVARPDMSIGAITAKKGAVPKGFDTGGVPSRAEFEDLFSGAKILGFFDLAKIVSLADLSGPGAAPQLTQRVQPDGSAELRYRWKAPLNAEADTGPGMQLATPKKLPAGVHPELVLDAKVVRSVGGQGQQTSVTGALRQVDLVVAKVVRLHFDALEFATEPGGKTRITPRGMGMSFDGDLAFLNEISSALQEAGLADKPAIEVLPSGITAGFSAAIPSLQVGMFALANLAVDTQLRIPFDGASPSFHFAICDRHRPFTVTVSIFGGGGFFALELGEGKVRRVEASLEFGGAASLDLVVASGSVYVMGGIYFSYDGAGVTAAGYLRCGGHLSVLGLVTVAVDFYMQLSYQPETGKIAGAASLTVGVKVLMFSKTVTLSVERQFAGSGGDPSFTDCFELEDWEDYCRAFA